MLTSEICHLNHNYDCFTVVYEGGLDGGWDLN